MLFAASPLQCVARKLFVSRPQCEVVYTYVGDIVVSVNPFKNTGSVGKVSDPILLLHMEEL